MDRTVGMILLWALILLTAGCFLYQFGLSLNAEVATQEPGLWEQAPGDKWLYVGGLMVLFSGSLLVAAVRICWVRNRDSSRDSLSR